MILFQSEINLKPSVIKYKYSIPIDDDYFYYYKPGKWSECSVKCGKGIQTRTIHCIEKSSQKHVDDKICAENNASKPEVEKICMTVDCDPEYVFCF